MINRSTILGLASEADNRPLRDLLLTVAGMLDADGKVIEPPDENETWDAISSPAGCYGKGLALSRRATEVYPPRAKVGPSASPPRPRKKEVA